MPTATVPERRPMPSSSASRTTCRWRRERRSRRRCRRTTCATAAGDLSDGIDEAGDPPTDEATGSVAALVTSGRPTSRRRSRSSAASPGLPSLTSKRRCGHLASTVASTADTLTARRCAAVPARCSRWCWPRTATTPSTCKTSSTMPDGSGDAALAGARACRR